MNTQEFLFTDKEGTAHVWLPDDEYLSKNKSGHIERGDFKFEFTGFKGVRVQAKGKNAPQTFVDYADCNGLITNVQVVGEKTYFTGHTSDGYQVSGHVYESQEGGGQGTLNLFIFTPRAFTVTGNLQYDQSGSETIQDTNQGGRVQIPKQHPG